MFALPHSVGQNGLQGKIPGELASLNLTAIDLLENELTGTVPEELYTLTELNYLNLGFNKLTGTVASELGNMNKLSEYHQRCLFVLYSFLTLAVLGF